MHSYIACTGHTFHDAKCERMLLLMNVIKGSHTGQRIAEELDHLLTSSNIRNKVQYIITDNASNMKKALQVLGEMVQPNDNDEGVSSTATDDSDVIDDEDVWNDLSEDDIHDVNNVIDRCSTERLSCYAHTLQLAIKDGLNKMQNATSVLAKSSKLANLVHQSAQFRELFESSFGSGRSIAKTNATRWNSLFHQLHDIAKLDPVKLSDLLRTSDHSNLIVTQREAAILKELIEILQPFAEATDILQGQNYTTIGCVVPSIVSLHKCLTVMLTSVKYHASLVNGLLASLRDRFSGLLENIKICAQQSATERSTPSVNFGSDIYLIASALDPNYALLWLEDDHPGTMEDKQSIRDKIISEYAK